MKNTRRKIYFDGSGEKRPKFLQNSELLTIISSVSLVLEGSPKMSSSQMIKIAFKFMYYSIKSIKLSYLKYMKN